MFLPADIVQLTWTELWAIAQPFLSAVLGAIVGVVGNGQPGVGLLGLLGTEWVAVFWTWGNAVGTELGVWAPLVVAIGLGLTAIAGYSIMTFSSAIKNDLLDA